ncbi:MAG TPA: hypothetical protein VE173_03090, partial [Longimicrobiales bacterium]|nr:hypothetical protein [Longimicrobiales bacterium]
MQPRAGTPSRPLKATTLPSGGTVAVPAPGWSRYQQAEHRRGVDWWERRGYRVVVDDRAYRLRRYLGDRPEDQAARIN